MAVYQVEQYYIYMSVKGINQDDLKAYLDSNGLDDYEVDGSSAMITIDGIESEDMAAQYEEEINQLRVNK